MSEGRRADRHSKRSRGESAAGSAEGAEETRGEPESPELPSGYRASRRTSPTAKRAKRAIRAHRLKENVGEGVSTARFVAGRLVYWSIMGAVGAAALVLVFIVVAAAVNGISRWIAEDGGGTPARAVREFPENLVIVGVEGTDAVGFIAMRMEEDEERINGVAIPAEAFVEVPGQGFEAIGDSWKAGAAVSKSAISNFLSVRFQRHIVLDAEDYKKAVEDQSLKGVMEDVRSSDLSGAEKNRIARLFDKVPSKDIALVPLPVKPLDVGEGTYYEPESEKLDELLYTWWGIKPGSGKQPTRVLVYNGAGRPGVAGEAAQALISEGFRVVDTKNADRFDYATTQIIHFRGPATEALRARQTLGVGKVVKQASDQNVTDLIVIVGKDYQPSK